MEVTKETVMRAWTDEQFRDELPEEVRQQIPARPVDEDGNQLTDEQLESAAGGTTIACVAGAVGVGGLVVSGFKAGQELEASGDSDSCQP